MKLIMLSLLLVLATFTAACGAGATATPVPVDDSTPTPAPTATPSPTPQGDPAWLAVLIAEFESSGVTDPAITISEYVYNGATVYFVPQRCCDVFSDLYHASGEIIAHPDGGIIGRGDGRAPDFAEAAKFVRAVWEDPRGQREVVLAPIESIELLILGSFPVQYRAHVVSGLPNGCTRFDHWTVDLDAGARMFIIEVLNTAPKPNADIACAMVYGTMEHSIPLENVEAGMTYNVRVHDQSMEFTAQ
jgi:hypothetical protein